MKTGQSGQEARTNMSVQIEIALTVLELKYRHGHLVYIRDNAMTILENRVCYSVTYTTFAIFVRELNASFSASNKTQR